MDVDRWVTKSAPYSGWVSVLLLCALWLAFIVHASKCPSREELDLLRERWDVDRSNLKVQVRILELQLENQNAKSKDSPHDP